MQELNQNTPLRTEKQQRRDSNPDMRTGYLRAAFARQPGGRLRVIWRVVPTLSPDGEVLRYWLLYSRVYIANSAKVCKSDERRTNKQRVSLLILAYYGSWVQAGVQQSEKTCSFTHDAWTGVIALDLYTLRSYIQALGQLPREPTNQSYCTLYET